MYTRLGFIGRHGSICPTSGGILVNNILLEEGGNLLLEDGGVILLEG